jgi:hypothetical protein
MYALDSLGPNYFLQGQCFGQSSNVFQSSGDQFAGKAAMERGMKRTLIRYKTKPEMADVNAELIKRVFEELKAAKLEGVRYLSLRLDDDTFVHLVETESDDSALPNLAAFKAFQSGIRERCVEPPVLRSATVVGNYRMLDQA